MWAFFSHIQMFVFLEQRTVCRQNCEDPEVCSQKSVRKISDSIHLVEQASKDETAICLLFCFKNVTDMLKPWNYYVLSDFLGQNNLKCYKYYCWGFFFFIPLNMCDKLFTKYLFKWNKNSYMYISYIWFDLIKG